ncbi:ribonuclease D [Oleiphilus messinensis]|uniref:Ribonuclease D n=1 Tax=Oleiphilus messinensis TaxID=141451 RepID=A0A1Y0IB46_9GAMM|nr:ribonuclease D [Oleiphilus messinensis]ARU57389.1 ribonuclease D [Oleiphilus messinensis]
MSLNVVFVASNEQLINLSRQWKGQRWLCVDTEFVRVNTFYPELGLLQIADEYGVYLVDPLACADLQVIADVLQDPQILKIMHSISEDIEVFSHALRCAPQNIFDTQIGAALAGKGGSIGYGALVEDYLSIGLPKSETRSDWLRRPLSSKQLDYSADDVRYLYPVYQKLFEELQHLGFYEAAVEESDRALNSALSNDPDDHYYLKLRGAWKLPTKKQQLLRSLCSWREQQAKSCNVPRQHVISDNALIEIAQRRPSSIQKLSRIPKLRPSVIKTHSDTLLKLIRESEFDSGEFAGRIPPPLRLVEQKLYKRLKAIVLQFSEQTGIAPEVVGRRKVLEKAVRETLDTGEVSLPDDFNGWRAQNLRPMFEREMQLFLASVTVE